MKPHLAYTLEYRLMALEHFARERQGELAAGTRTRSSAPIASATLCRQILKSIEQARAAVESGDAEVAAVSAMQAIEWEYMIMLSDDLNPTLSAGNNALRANRANRALRPNKFGDKDRKWVVAQFDSAKRQGEPHMQFIKTNATLRFSEPPSDPVIRTILREAGRIPPARKRK